MIALLLLACAESVCIEVAAPYDLAPCLVIIDGEPQDVAADCTAMVCVADGERVELRPVDEVP